VGAREGAGTGGDGVDLKVESSRFTGFGCEENIPLLGELACERRRKNEKFSHPQLSHVFAPDARRKS